MMNGTSVLGACLGLTLFSVAAPCGLAEAEDVAPKICNIILHNQADTSIVGLRKFVERAKERKLWDRIHITVLLNGTEPQSQADQCDFFKELVKAGHEISVERIEMREPVEQWLGLAPKSIVTTGAQLFGDAWMEQQAQYVKEGYRACANACVEGNSLAEFWDIPHNWEGAPMFPYWVQWDAENPLRTARTNRELAKDRAVLELQWASRTLFHDYDRFPIPQCFHFGEPLKHAQWNVGQLIHRGEGAGWWRVELEQYERNLDAGRLPFLYLNTASEGNIFTPGGPWSPMLDTEEALECALDLVELMLERGWNLWTVQEFTGWFSTRWPCPNAPSMILLMNDTLANRRDLNGRIIVGHGRLLHAETRYFQICDHENRMAPEMIIGYALESPNLLRGGYTLASPEKWNDKESWDGHYASTTGNALFWSPSPPLSDIEGKPYFPPHKSPECRNRTFTLYLGDDWEPYQFAQGEIFDVRREGDVLSWSKRMLATIKGSDIRLIYHNTLDGPRHRVKIEVEGNDAVGKPVRVRVCPFFHPGLDHPSKNVVSDPRMPALASMGQEHNVFARVGDQEFAFSESNEKPVVQEFASNGSGKIMIFNRNPGTSGQFRDNPDFNRGMTLTVPKEAVTKCVDDAGPSRYVTVLLELGEYKKGASYEFEFEYWHGAPK